MNDVKRIVQDLREVEYVVPQFEHTFSSRVYSGVVISRTITMRRIVLQLGAKSTTN